VDSLGKCWQVGHGVTISCSAERWSAERYRSCNVPRAMLPAGSVMPDLTLFGPDAEPVALRSLTPVVLAFYLFDWTGT
jgi:hypothetical protein